MAASVMTGAISLANSVTAPSNRGSLALPVFSLVKNLLNTVPASPATVMPAVLIIVPSPIILCAICYSKA